MFHMIYNLFRRDEGEKDTRKGENKSKNKK